MDSEKLEMAFICSVCGGGARLTPEKAAQLTGQVCEMMDLLAYDQHDYSPFALINLLHTQKGVEAALKTVGIQQAASKAEAICRTAGLWVADMVDLNAVTVKQLESIKFVGPKTARHFLLTVRPESQVVVLEQELLRHLKEKGSKGVPVLPPGKGPVYDRLEAEFIELAAESGLSLTEYREQVLSSNCK